MAALRLVSLTLESTLKTKKLQLKETVELGKNIIAARHTMGTWLAANKPLTKRLNFFTTVITMAYMKLGSAAIRCQDVSSQNGTWNKGPASLLNLPLRRKNAS